MGERTSRSGEGRRQPGGERTRHERLYRSSYRALKSMRKALPVVLAVVLLLGLVQTYVPRATLAGLFSGQPLSDTAVGAIAGSVSAGNALTSYVIGGELLASGVSRYAVTAFVVAWVTVGVVQFPAEATILGRRFALVRNGTGLLLSVVVAIATVWTLQLL